MTGGGGSRASPTAPRRTQHRRLAERSVLDALHVMSDAVTFALLDDHPELLLRLSERDLGPPRDLDEEAQRLVDLLEQIREAVRRYVRLADPDDGLPF